jgi:exonuclease SbcD
MKILHTADWHIGKKLHGYDLLSDQAYILDQIKKIAQEEAVDAIVIAGDLYDRSVPSEDSVRLLNQTIAEWNLTEQFPLLAISGNHDSAKLSFTYAITGRATSDRDRQYSVLFTSIL